MATVPVTPRPVELMEALEVLARPLRDMSVALHSIFRLLMDVRMVMEDHLWEMEDHLWEMEDHLWEMEDHLWEMEKDVDRGPSNVQKMLGEDGVEELREEVGLLAEEQEEF
jgi:hypothetical protein